MPGASCRQPWASFDVFAGSLTGTPDAGDGGFYSNIEISVTDGIHTPKLPAFSIEVVASGSATGSITVEWRPPTQNENGSQLMNLAAYRLYWSRDGGGFRISVRVNNPDITRYVVDGLPSGTYKVVITAISIAGVGGRTSNAVTRLMQ